MSKFEQRPLLSFFCVVIVEGALFAQGFGLGFYGPFTPRPSLTHLESLHFQLLHDYLALSLSTKTRKRRQYCEKNKQNKYKDGDVQFIIGFTKHILV